MDHDVAREFFALVVGQAKAAGLMSNEHFSVDNGLIVDMCITHAHGRAEVEAAHMMLERNEPTRSRRTVAADKGYDTRDFVEGCRKLGVTPHVAMNTGRSGGSAIDGRTSRHEGYLTSQRFRKRIEEIFGWEKTVANFRKTRFQGKQQNEMASLLIGAAYNLVRMAKLMLPLA